MANLTELYEALPHGVTKNGNSYFAVFKMVVSIKEMSDPPEGGVTINKNWEELVERIDQTRWFYRLENNKLILEKQMTTATGPRAVPSAGFRELKFNIRGLNTPGV